MDFSMKDKMQDKEVLHYDSEKINILDEKLQICHQENITLDQTKSIGDKIDLLMPGELPNKVKLHKAPKNENIYFPEDYAKTIQEIIDKKYSKKIEDYKAEIEKKEQEVNTSQAVLDRYNLRISEYTTKAKGAINEAAKADANEIAETFKALKKKLEPKLKAEKSALDKLNKELQQREKDQAALEYVKKLPETLENLWVKKDTILQSKHNKEKEDFLEALSKVSQCLKDLERISNYGFKKDRRIYDIVPKIDEKLVDISDIAAQVAGQLIDFKQLEAKRNELLTTSQEEYKAKFGPVDDDIEKKKAFINALNQKLGQPVTYHDVVITEAAKKEVADIVKRTEQSYVKDTLQSYVDANIQIVSALLLYKDEKYEGSNLKKEINARTEGLDIIRQGMTIHAWVKNIVDNQQNVLNSKYLKDKYQFIANVMKMDKFLHFAPLDESNMTSDEKLFLSLVAYVTIHKRQLEDTARKVSVQIFDLLNTEYKEPEFDLEALKAELDNRKDEIALLDTDVKYKMYNPLEHIEDFRLKEAAYKRCKISDAENGLTPKQRFNFRVKISEEKTDCILAYEKIYKKVKGQLTEMLKGVSADEKEDLAIFLASLSEPAQKIIAIDKITAEVSLTWEDDIEVTELEEAVDIKYKAKKINIDHVAVIEDEKIRKVKEYEARLWDDVKYGSTSMEEMYFNIGKKAVDKAFYEKTSLLKKKLKEKVIAIKQAAYDKETVEYKKGVLQVKLYKANAVFELGKTIDENKKVERLVELKNNKALLKNKRMQELYINIIELLETYKRGLTDVVDFELQKSDEYKNAINAIDWQLNALAGTTAQVALSLVDFDKVKTDYQAAIDAYKDRIQKSREKNDAKIDALSQDLQLVEFKIYVIKVIQAGIIGEKNINDDIKRVPDKYQEAAKEFYQSISRFNAEDLYDALAICEESRDIVFEELKRYKKSIKEDQEQIDIRTEEARLIDESKGLFTFAQNLVREKNIALASDQVKDKVTFLDQIADINKLRTKLSQQFSIESGGNLRYFKGIERYFDSQKQQLIAAAREVVANMDSILLKDYQLPSISLSETLSKLKNTKEMNQVVRILVAYKMYNPPEESVDDRAKAINEFIEEFLQGSVIYSSEEKVAFIKELAKQRKECAKKFCDYYETLKLKYKGQFSDACIGFIATQSEVHQNFVAFNNFTSTINDFIHEDEDADAEFQRIKKVDLYFAEKRITDKAQNLSDDACEFERKFMDSNKKASELEKIFMNYGTQILNNARV